MPRILLVEDDHDVRMLLQHVLLSADYEVDTAATVNGGCSLLETRNYDLVVSDIRLDDGSGTAVAETAREKGVPTLLLTGYAFIRPDAGADLTRYTVLLKPVRPDELVAAAAKVLEAAAGGAIRSA